MDREDDRLTRLTRALAAALEEFATSASPSAEPAIVVDRPPRPGDEHALGKRQRQIVEVAGLAADEGMKTADVAAAIDYEVPNTYAALQALARAQVVEQVPGKEPQHWRLVPRYREGARAYARAVATLAEGEWTTPEDVSIAVRGDVRASDAVRRAQLSHRVVSPNAVSDEQRERLREEGVTFLDERRPDPGCRVVWDDLARRVAGAETRRRTMAKGVLNYVQIPAVDLERSITFYEAVFGWESTRQPTKGALVDQTTYPEFTDSTGQVGGAFVLADAVRDGGITPCVAVESIDETLAAVVANGGEVVVQRTPIVEGTDWEAVFRDPAGNTIGLYEEAEG